MQNGIMDRLAAVTRLTQGPGTGSRHPRGLAVRVAQAEVVRAGAGPVDLEVEALIVVGERIRLGTWEG